MYLLFSERLYIITRLLWNVIHVIERSLITVVPKLGVK